MIYTITSTLPLSHGGRTQALLRRIKLIDEEFGIASKILTTNYNGNHPSIYKHFLKENKVTENMYEWLSGFKLFKTPKTFITRNPKYVKIQRNIKDFTHKEERNGSIIVTIAEKTMYDFENTMAHPMFLNMRALFLPLQD